MKKCLVGTKINFNPKGNKILKTISCWKSDTHHFLGEYIALALYSVFFFLWKTKYLPIWHTYGLQKLIINVSFLHLLGIFMIFLFPENRLIGRLKIAKRIKLGEITFLEKFKFHQRIFQCWIFSLMQGWGSAQADSWDESTISTT